jgi:seryl-tRNA synthetase
VVLLCSGDMSFAAAKCYDFEVWAPGVGQWLECSSCSNFEDFQARRMAMRFRREPSAKASTLTRSTLRAWPCLAPSRACSRTTRPSAAPCGIPAALRPYLGGLEELTPEV